MVVTINKGENKDQIKKKLDQLEKSTEPKRIPKSLIGAVKFDEDGVEYQRRIRDEW